MKRFLLRAMILLIWVTLSLAPRGVLAQNQGPVAAWSFDGSPGAATHDSVSGVWDRIKGFYKYVPGVSGSGLRFDGYTTTVLRSAGYAPKLRNSFSIEAWVALDTYPWNWVPVIDQEEYRQTGFLFGIDAFGHIGLQAAIGGKWQSLTSTAQLPLKKWAQIVGTFDKDRGLSIYVDGNSAGELAVQGSLTPAEGADLLIGRVREPLLPVPSDAIHPRRAVWYSFDGIMDEVKVYDRSLAPEEVRKTFAATRAPQGEVLPWPALPSGPSGPGRFGAYYYSLKYQDTWDRPRRTGPDSDVVVRFDQSPIRLVFWQGAHPDPVTGWFDWADEYWTVYPDGVAVRKQVLRTTNLKIPHEWQETIIINAPGTTPEDNINLDALTLANMWGESATYSWRPKPPGVFARPNGPEKVDRPGNTNIQVVNLKSNFKPFQVVPPARAQFNIYSGEKTYFTFECWNHWPVAQIPSSGRPALAPDRASHTSLSHILWDAYQTSENTISKILLAGLTTQSASGLIPLAKSWLSPPKLEVASGGFHSEGYDPTQRAFVLALEGTEKSPAIEVSLLANDESPVINPAILVKNWGDGGARLTLDGKAVAPGKDLRLGHVPRMDGTDLIVWIERQSTRPLRIRIDPI